MTDPCWHCPLLNRDIPDGLCLDINYQRLKFFKPNDLTKAMQETGKSIEDITLICEACPNQPLTEQQPSPHAE